MRLNGTRLGSINYGRGGRDRLYTAAGSYPSLDLNFAKNKNLIDSVSKQSLVTFTRASSGTYVDSDGLIKTAAIDEPRFDHNPTTGESLGLLVEESRTNLLTYSEDFTNAIWSTSSTATITASTGIDDPQGTNTAATITNVSGSNLHRLISGTAGVAYTYSIWIRRRSGSGLVYLTVGDAINQQVTVTDNWTRVSATGTPTSTVVRAYVLIASTGNAVDVWGAQLEAGSFPTSYIPTTGTTATRSADVARITGAAFSSWYRQDEGTIYSQFYPAVVPFSAGRPVWILSDGVSSRIDFRCRPSSKAGALVQDAGVTQVDTSGTNNYSVSRNSGVFAYAINNFASCLNAETPVDDTSGTVPTTINQLQLSASGNIVGALARVVFWKSRLGNATLQALTQ